MNQHRVPSTRPHLVVGIGASAGGLDAVKQLLGVLPADTGFAYVLVQHLDSRHKGPLIDVIAPSTSLRVREAEHGAAVEPNTLYVIEPDTALGVHDGKLTVEQAVLQGRVRSPLDYLFLSLAEDQKARAVAIVLSAAGIDGTVGLREVQSRGGRTIAQRPSTAAMRGMPQSAIDAGVVDLVLELEQIPQALLRYAELGVRAERDDKRGGDDPDAHRALAVAGPEGVADSNTCAMAPKRRGAVSSARGRVGELHSLRDSELARLTTMLEAQTSFDLRVYKRPTIERRVIRRMTLGGFETVERYIANLQAEPNEQVRLMKDLLIGVTEFFRDPECFRALNASVIEPLVAALADNSELRVWVPGCATGEEAYSLAVLFLDALERHGKFSRLQVFATDIERDSLIVGRAGVYPSSIEQQVPRDLLERYFHVLDGRGYRARPVLRDAISFAVHDLTKDPPFSRMDLVSCRNVLIYLTGTAQEQVLRNLHYALVPSGCLFLSTSESTGAGPELFATVSKPDRIYRKIDARRGARTTPSWHPSGESTSAAESESTLRQRRPISSDDQARRAVLHAWVPPTVIVGGDGIVTFVHGELSPFLKVPEGDRPALDFGSMVRPALATRAQGALFRARRSRERVVAETSDNGERIRITAVPAEGLADETVILSFERLRADTPRELESVRSPVVSSDDASALEELEVELRATKEDLRDTVEQLENSNEELRSSNEESMSMNEELQSANEELEATTEELRSLNEELTTVNTQLREKIEQVEIAHDDLRNFFASTKVATIFLDDALRIKRFTPAARQLLGIDHADVGRAIEEFSRELLNHGLADECRSVLESLSEREREIAIAGGGWIARRVLPYRTDTRHIEGVVVTYTDVSELKRATERLEQRERQQRVIALIGALALRERNLQAFMDRVVRDVQETLRVDYSKILELQPGGDRLLLRAGVGWRPGLVGHAWVSSGSHSQAGYTLQSTEPVIVDDLGDDRRFDGPALLTDHHVVSGLSCVIRDGETSHGVIGAHTVSRRVFTREDADFLQAIASTIGAAVSRYQERRRLTLELDCAQCYAESHDLESAVAALLPRILTELHGAFGELWVRRDHELVRMQLHTRAPAQSDSFERYMPSAIALGADSLVSAVFNRRETIWQTDLSDPGLASADGAQNLSLLSALGFPIVAGNTQLGVVAVYARERMFVSSALLTNLTALGRGLGDVALRWQIEARARRLASITECSQDAIVAYDRKGIIEEWLPGAERLFGYTRDQMLGTSIERILPEKLRVPFRAVNDRILNGELIEPFETSALAQNGTEIDLSVRISPVRDANGAVVGVSAADRDITYLKRTERRLREADRHKDDFLAMLGHELRNPLAAISTAAQVLRLRPSAEVIEHTHTVMQRQTAHMAKLLDGLLDISRIIRGRIRLERGTVDFTRVCDEVVDDLRERTGDRDLRVEVERSADPIHVDGDATRLAQVVDNLLGNAEKYTPDGGTITVSLERVGDRALLTVRDTGVGIEPDLMPHIFDTFRQSEQTLDRSEGGLGLGLALVNSIVELHGGTVAASSAGRGLGSEFRVELPALPKRRVSSVDAPPAPNGTIRVLLVEDNQDAADMLRTLLELSGHSVTVATRGREAVKRARESLPEVVLCDLGLPEGYTGFDVAEALRSDPATRSISLIALSGYGGAEAKARGRAAGFDAHVTKPVDVSALNALLERLSRREAIEDEGGPE